MDDHIPRLEESSPPAISLVARDQLRRLGALLRRAARFWLPALLTVVTCVGLTTLFDRYRPREYRSEALLVYREGVRWSLLGAGDAGDPSRHLGAALQQMLNSRSRLAPLVAEHHLYAGRLDVDPVVELRAHLGFRATGDTFALHFDGPTPEVAEAVTAQLVRGLVDDSAAAQREQAVLTRDFLLSEHKRSEAELQQREVDLARFLANHPEFARRSRLPGELGAMVRPSDDKKRAGASDTDSALASLRRRLSSLRSGGSSSSPAPAVAPEVSGPAPADPAQARAQAQAEAEVQAARKDLAERRAVFTDLHPDVVGARRRLEAAEAKLRVTRAGVDTAGRRVVAAPREPSPPPSPVRTEAERNAEIAKVTAQIAALESMRERDAEVARPAPVAPEVTDAVALETEWARLSRGVDETEEQHRQLETRLFRAGLLVSSANAQIAVVDAPYLPRQPRPPGRRTVYAAGGAAALLLGLLVALGAALLDDRVRVSDDLVGLGTGTVLATVPRSVGGSGPGAPLLLRSAPDSPGAAAYRVLRYRLVHHGDPRIVAVTSADPDEGAAACAANLALALAEHDQPRVLLVDADPRAPSLAALFEAAPSPDSAAALSIPGEARLRRLTALHPAPLVLAALEPAAAGGATLDGNGMHRALAALRDKHFDYIVLAAPAVLGAADVNLLAEAVDAVILVARAHHSSSRAIRAAAQQLAPERPAGVVLVDA